MSLDWDEAYRSGQYRKHWDLSTASQEIATCAALGLFPRDGVILDAGCGSGSDAVFLAARGFRVKALDISSAALDLVKRRLPKLVYKSRQFTAAQRRCRLRTGVSTSPSTGGFCTT